MQKTMTAKRKRAFIGAVTLLAVAAPTVQAVAAEISGSRIPFSIATSGSKEDGDRWNGKSSGKAKACGDVPVNDSRTFSGYIYHDRSWAPDPKIASVSKNYSSRYGCGSYKSTSRSNKYYTKASWAGIPGSRAYGHVNAQN
ncbi:hypothetical protein ABZW18_23265 [Streptomyces sp. NPDC004647]|uniref:hypothetical protein n=1 Tax=Streptomyces sp. NPDC004647 TaxID=3154671 RepID=UPI0033A765DD